jgi:excisionase family DNA binding protein
MVSIVAAESAAPGGRGQANGPMATHAGQLVMHTAEEAARLLKVKRSWLERQAAARKIPFSMLGGSYRFSDRHLAEIVRLNEVPPALSAPDAPAPAGTPRKTQTGEESPATVAPLRPRPRAGPRRA